jgi:hypothetical protein
MKKFFCGLLVAMLFLSGVQAVRTATSVGVINDVFTIEGDTGSGPNMHVFGLTTNDPLVLFDGLTSGDPQHPVLKLTGNNSSLLEFNAFRDKTAMTLDLLSEAEMGDTLKNSPYISFQGSIYDGGATDKYVYLQNEVVDLDNYGLTVKDTDKKALVRFMQTGAIALLGGNKHIQALAPNNSLYTALSFTVATSSNKYLSVEATAGTDDMIITTLGTNEDINLSIYAKTNGVLTLGKNEDSTIVINGNISSNGTLTKYGEMYITSANATSTAITTTTEYVKIDLFNEGDENGFAFSDSQLTASAGGKYEVNYNVSAIAASTNDVFNYNLFVNGAEVTESGCMAERKYANTDLGSVSGGCIITLEPGDNLDLRVANVTDTDNITIKSTNFRIIKL